MKILFICSSLEPGLDGVGDYTRLLAVELIKSGLLTAVLSLNDKHISSEFKGVQHTGGIDLPVLRLPSTFNIKQRLHVAKKYINDFDPEWLSLQFVIFGYHPKGLPFGMGRQLAFIGGERRWHIMFHEIWQGESKSDSLKQRIIGRLQKMIVRDIAQRIKAAIFTTSNMYYRIVLSKNGISATQQQIFSNLPYGDKLDTVLLDKLPSEILNNRDKYIIGVLFGAIHFDEYVLIALQKLQQLTAQTRRKLVITHIGKTEGIEKLSDYLRTLKDVYFDAYGFQSAQNIADYLCQADIGLSTNPKILIEKSGSTAAMLHNGLPVVLLSAGFEHDSREIAYIKETNEIEDLDEFIGQRKDFKINYSVNSATKNFMTMLNDIKIKITLL
ncbi:MAG: hypothetical protein JWR12_586 [Mucilaginibacter sp.]|nr:hypothetical protein [Mucilaginibacter sp.]